MYSYNRVHIIGYQTQPVELRQTPSGTNVTDLNLVVPYAFQAESGEKLSGKSFFPVTVWGPMAEVASQFVRPGSQVFIAGRLQTDSWEDSQTKEKRSKTKLVALDMILLDPRDGQRAAPGDAPLVAECLNQVHLVGNVTRDPELRTTTSGQHVLTLGIATNDRWKDRTTNEDRERAEFHSVVAWRELAEQLQRAVRKGSRVYVSGRLQTRSWETQDGSKRTTTEVIADRVLLLGIENAVAKESVTTEAFAGRTRAGSDELPPKAPEGEAVAVPPVAYTSEVTVEDLPF